MTSPTRPLVALLAATALAACGGGGARPQSAPPPIVGATAGEVNAAFALLMAGKEGDARKQLVKLLARDPMSANAHLLKDSIERDPKDLLGPQSYPYPVKAGDTPEGLAQRLLGNRLKAYQLMRYNGLKAPVALTPGQMLKIPGEPPRVEPVRRPEPMARPTPSGSSARTRPAPAKAVAARPAAPAATQSNPAAARAARAGGLAALNGGDVNRAVALLRRAASLNPGNPVVARDLARAERIAATVRARR